MKPAMLRILLLSFLALRFPLFAAEPKTIDPRIDNLRAFAKLYGYVRFFHPSDEASAIDWTRFAVLGAVRISQLSPSDELRPALESLFLPIAPSMQFLSDGETAMPPANETADAGLDVVAWQHLGVGLGVPGPYRSARLNRKNEAGSSSRFGSVTQSIDAAPYRGMEIRLTASVKTDVEPGNQAQLWLRVDRADNRMGFFDNMGDRPITSRAWAAYEITGKVSDDAQRVFFGGFLSGRGQVWVDDFKLAARPPGGAWTPVSLENAGFESGTVGEAPSRWAANTPGYSFVTQRQEHSEGEQAVRIANVPVTFEGALFDARPKIGEVTEVQLRAGLRARVPLALLSKNGQTLPPPDAAQLDRLRKALAGIDSGKATAAQREVRLAGVVITWNIFQHFYPYFDVVKTDWDSVLTESLSRAMNDQSAEQFQETLQWMVVQLHDGHGSVYQPALAAGRARLPFLADWIDEKVVIVAVEKDGPLQVGDIVRSIDGTAAEVLLKREEQLRSGSPQWKRVAAFLRLGTGPKGSEARMVVDRVGKTLELHVQRSSSGDLREPRPANFSELRPGILYVDLGTADMKAIDARVEDLAAARGVVFDLRGYPKGNHDVLRYLTSEAIQSAQWLVPQTIYPDRQGLVGYERGGRWLLEPKKPRLRGKVVFLTGAGAISYAESVMGIVEHYRLGEIVGQTTAGTNGNMNSFGLPGGFQISWTGMRVLKNDGSQHHLVGIRPTVPAQRTLRGVRAGRDEILEKALQVIEAAPVSAAQ
jgi:C-terminal processing protease CtpA/Prc